MIVKKFNLNEDLTKLENYLRGQYEENKNMTSWLPERLNDLIFRMDRHILTKVNLNRLIIFTYGSIMIQL